MLLPDRSVLKGVLKISSSVQHAVDKHIRLDYLIDDMVESLRFKMEVPDLNIYMRKRESGNY
ncbi:MAG: hypothetical protein GY801_17895 [bacterium]|nr:hypothetical protein [bacterium]